MTGRFLMLASFLLPLLHAEEFPQPAKDLPASGKAAIAVLAGGCFWGVEAVFDHLKGVTSAVSGYAGGTKSTAVYEVVSSGRTGHAESVKVTYDPSQISYGRLLQVFFSVVHDPTQVDRQGPDTGTQYRSVIFYETDEQKRIAESYIQQLNTAKVFPAPVATQVKPLTAFYPAEAVHQDFVAHNPNYAYVVTYELPKLRRLQRQYPKLYVGQASPGW